MILLSSIFVSGVSQAQWPPPPEAVPDSRYDGYLLLTPSILRDLQKQDQIFITFAGTPSCGVANLVAAALLEYQRTKIPEIPIYIVDITSAEVVRRVAKPSGSVPLILIFKGEKLLDGQVGLGGAATGDFFDAMMERQGLPRSGLGEFGDEGNLYWRKTWKGGPPKRYQNFQTKTFAEVDLRDANLSGKIFIHSVITHSNFRHAVLGDGDFDDTVWINTICPDGSNSDEHDYTCVGF